MPRTHATPPRDRSGAAYFYAGARHPSFLVSPFGWPGDSAYVALAPDENLPPALLLPQYFIEDYDYYGLAPPPPDYEWIRYGPDLLLIDLDSRQIRQVVRGVFRSPAPGVIVPRGIDPPGATYADPNFLPGDPLLPGQY